MPPQISSQATENLEKYSIDGDHGPCCPEPNLTCIEIKALILQTFVPWWIFLDIFLIPGSFLSLFLFFGLTKLDICMSLLFTQILTDIIK